MMSHSPMGSARKEQTQVNKNQPCKKTKTKKQKKAEVFAKVERTKQVPGKGGLTDQRTHALKKNGIGSIT